MSGPSPSDSAESTVSFPRQYAITQRYSLGAPRTITVSADGRRVLFLRSAGSTESALSLWLLDVETGEERAVVDPRQLGADDRDLPPAERARRERARESAGGVVTYSTDREARWAAFGLAGQLFVVDLDNRTVSSIEAAEGAFDPRLDPSGTRLAYVSGRSLRIVERGDDGWVDDRTLAAEPDELVSWGRAEFVAGEEMSRTRGFWWAPDGSAVLASRVDESPVARWWIADPANPDREPVETRYPAAGSTNAIVGLAMIDLAGTISPFDWTDGSYEYLADVVWRSGRPPLVVRQTRDQRTVSIAELDIESLTLTDRHVITDDTWVELMPGSPSWSGSRLLTIEDRAIDDHRALCLDGDPITSPDVNVRSIVEADEHRAVVTVWTDPTEIHVGMVDLDAPDTGVTMRTRQPGVHDAAVGGSTVVVSRSAVDQPGVQVEAEAAGTIRQIANLAATPVLSARPRFLELGPGRLRAALLLPPEHDGSEALPVLLDPYGGPHAQRVLRAHNAHLVSQWFADQGFAVLVVDGRGTPGRGPAFERTVWGDLAQPVLDDQIAALDAAADQLGFLDLDRVGIRGWSFGGYLAALAVMRRPDRVHAAVAGAPVTTWRLYDTHYTERYLGHPDVHPEHYDQTDLVLDADRLERPLLLIHGLADDNVVAAHTLRFSSALLAAGRVHQVLPLSGVTHMTPQEVVAENLLHLQRDFLKTNLVG